MHFPEEQLTTYLRIFLPPARIDDVLDQIAEAALESEVEDEISLFSLAHQLMDADDRRTDDLEAAVLVEEVGLSLDEVAIILDLDAAQVETAVATAWADVSPMPAEEEETAAEPAPAVLPATAARRSSGGWWALALAAVALGVLAVATFSDAGQARLNAVGIDPLVAFVVVVGFIGGGAALVKAGTADAPVPPDPARSDPSDAQAAPWPR